MPALKSREEVAGPSVVRFLAEIGKLYVAARERGRAWLTWEEWQLWADAAIRCGLVTEAELAADHRPKNAAEFRLAVLLTWARVMESRDLGRTAEQHYRREVLAMQAERDEKTRAEAEANERRREQLSRPGSSKKIHHGASGDL